MLGLSGFLRLRSGPAPTRTPHVKGRTSKAAELRSADSRGRLSPHYHWAISS